MVGDPVHRSLPARDLRLRRGRNPLAQPRRRVRLHPGHRSLPAVSATSLSPPVRPAHVTPRLRSDAPSADPREGHDGLDLADLRDRGAKLVRYEGDVSSADVQGRRGRRRRGPFHVSQKARTTRTVMLVTGMLDEAPTSPASPRCGGPGSGQDRRTRGRRRAPDAPSPKTAANDLRCLLTPDERPGCVVRRGFRDLRLMVRRWQRGRRARSEGAGDPR